jgi:hypothetical protein
MVLYAEDSTHNRFLFFSESLTKSFIEEEHTRTMNFCSVHTDVSTRQFCRYSTKNKEISASTADVNSRAFHGKGGVP